MVTFEVAKMAHDVNEDVWRAACEIKIHLAEIGKWQSKVTGVGGWAILAVLLALVASFVFTSYALSYIVSISHPVAEILVTQSSPQSNVTLLNVLSLLIFFMLFYGTGYILAKKLFGQKLLDARQSLKKFYLATERDVFLKALLFLDKTGIAIPDSLNKDIKTDYTAYNASIAKQATA